ncbi:MAG: cation diffusion facilitator family transporter [Bdellovibrionota bacterium]
MPPQTNKTALQTNQSDAPNDSLLSRASYISLVVSVLLLLAKFYAFNLTRSQAIFSDAMESVVNVVAAGLAIFVIWYARKPADQDHPYGHGKVEFFSAAFEGGLVAFASLLICFEAVRALYESRPINELGFGVLITLVTGGANAVLGLFLIRAGKKRQSAALEASGLHVLTDFWTSAGVALGLGLVVLTGKQWLDPVVALVMGLFLAKTGFGLVQKSVGSLLDAEDKELLEKLLNIIGTHRPTGIIQVHHARIMRSGHFHHIDAHAVVPEYWDVAEAHEKTEDFESELIRRYPYPGELHLHVDPCRRAYCRNCDVTNCPIRKHPFEHLRQLSIEELTNPEEPSVARKTP